MSRLRAIRQVIVSESTGASPLLAYVDVKDLAPIEGLIRLGSSYGGWIIPRDAQLDSDSICYLVGAGEDISFDCAVVMRFQCKVRILDPTPRAIDHFRHLEEAVCAGRRFPVNNSSAEYYDIEPSDVARISYLPIGLSDRDVELKFFLPKNPEHVSCSTVNLQKTSDFFMAQCHRVGTIMAQQGDTRLDLLKIDIEGAEYAVINDLLLTKLLPRLLLVEFDEVHSPLDDNAASRIHDHIRRLTTAGMRCVAVDGCNATFVRQW